jgi:hypothetical protein
MTKGRDVPVVTVISETSFAPLERFPVGFVKITSTGSNLPSGLLIQMVESNDGSRSVPSMLTDLKNMTGWSWDRLASALGRTRQALHGWYTGREVTTANAERVAKLYATLAFIDRGSVESNNAVLIERVGGGKILADLVDEGRYEEVRAIAGSGARDDVTQLAKRADDARRAETSRSGHWVDRLATAAGDEVPFAIVPAPGKSRRVAVRRQG